VWVTWSGEPFAQDPKRKFHGRNAPSQTLGFGRGRAETNQSEFDAGEMSGINAEASPFAITVGEF